MTGTSPVLYAIGPALSNAVDVHILQSHSRLKRLAEIVARSASLEPMADPIQAPCPVGRADLLPGLARGEMLSPAATLGGSPLVQELVQLKPGAQKGPLPR